MRLKQQLLGRAPDGAEVWEFTASNSHGLTMRTISLGATLTAVEVPDRHGNVANVTLYLETLEEYLRGHPCFGSICGRYANRIAKGRFVLDGVEYRLATNDGPNHLHGGTVGFDKRVWKGQPVDGASAAGATFTLESPDGEEGYPGRLVATVTYRLTEADELVIQYEATADKPTHVNLTNHAYWNLAGAGSGDCLDHVLTLQADHYLPVDETLAPLGPLAPVDGTPMDFTTPHRIGQRLAQVPGGHGGYDHCYVLRKQPGVPVPLAARLEDPTSGRVMEVYTSQPGIQLYTANALDGSFQAGGKRYGKYAAVCLEAQHFPDSPNRPEYPSTVLRPGQIYRQTTLHRFRDSNKTTVFWFAQCC